MLVCRCHQRCLRLPGIGRSWKGWHGLYYFWSLGRKKPPKWCLFVPSILTGIFAMAMSHSAVGGYLDLSKVAAYGTLMYSKHGDIVPFVFTHTPQRPLEGRRNFMLWDRPICEKFPPPPCLFSHVSKVFCQTCS